MGLDQVMPAQERRFEDRAEPVHLHPVLVQEAGELDGIVRRERGDRPLHPRHVAGRLQLAAAAEDQVILRVQPDKLHLAAEVAADRAIDRFEHARIEEERRPQVEPEALALDRGRSGRRRGRGARGPSPGTRRRRAAWRRQPARPRPDDHDLFRRGHERSPCWTSAAAPRAGGCGPPSERSVRPIRPDGRRSSPTGSRAASDDPIDARTEGTSPVIASPVPASTDRCRQRSDRVKPRSASPGSAACDYVVRTEAPATAVRRHRRRASTPDLSRLLPGIAPDNFPEER